MIVVAPGLYPEVIDFGGKAVVLISESGADVTFLDGVSGGSVVECTSGETAATRIVGFTISGGDATSGGGMLIDDASPTIEACVFESNSATSGGGLHIRGTSSPLVSACTFLANDADFGGAVSVRDGATPRIVDCKIDGNRARFGGGAEVRGGASPLFTSVVFEQNVATTGSGGGLYVNASVARVVECRFEDNVAEEQSGGGLISISSDMRVTNSLFVGNSASQNGGGAYNSAGAPRYANCVFERNTALFGGGMYSFDQSQPTVVNCTFAANVASSQGGGIISLFGSTTLVANSIAWGNTPDQIMDFQTASTVDHTCVEGGWSGAGTGNVDGDPRFVEPDAGDFRIAATSPCLDTADNAALPADADDIDADDDMTEALPLDMAGTDRSQYNGVDMGAYESVTSFCGTDVDDNGRVGFADLVLVLNAWGTCKSCSADFDQDDLVGFGDLLLLLASWGPCTS